MTSRQEYRELPAPLRLSGRGAARRRPRKPRRGIGRFLDPANSCPRRRGHRRRRLPPRPYPPRPRTLRPPHHPRPPPPGRLSVDAVGCAARARPAYYSGLDAGVKWRRRPAATAPAPLYTGLQRVCGGYRRRAAFGERAWPPLRCIERETAEVFLADGVRSAPRPRSPADAAGELLSPRSGRSSGSAGLPLSDAQEQARIRSARGRKPGPGRPDRHGKTESAMLPVFDRLLATAGGVQGGLRHPSPVVEPRYTCADGVVVPGTRSRPVSGTDTPQNERRKQALNPPDLPDHDASPCRRSSWANAREHLKNVRCVIIDEIHGSPTANGGCSRSRSKPGRLRGRVPADRPLGNRRELRMISGGSSAGPGRSRSSRCRWRATSGSASGLPGRFCRPDAGRRRLPRRPGVHPVFVNTRVTAEALGHELYPAATSRSTTGRSRGTSGSRPKNGSGRARFGR